MTTQRPADDSMQVESEVRVPAGRDPDGLDPDQPPVMRPTGPNGNNQTAARRRTAKARRWTAARHGATFGKVENEQLWLLTKTSHISSSLILVFFINVSFRKATYLAFINGKLNI